MTPLVFSVCKICGRVFRGNIVHVYCSSTCRIAEQLEVSFVNDL